tara:strand:- start:9311 stop:10162 length:852 start_codon:yes stop_codon:yes gene_type:complete
MYIIYKCILGAAVVLPIYYYCRYNKQTKETKIDYKKGVIITGGGGALGSNLARKFLENGSKVLLIDINKESLDNIPKNPLLQTIVCDISSNVEVIDKLKNIDLNDYDTLINNAGIVNKKPLVELSSDEITKTFNVNTFSLFWMTKFILPHFIKKNQGHIITIASIAGLAGSKNLVDYCSSKFAAVGFHKSLRLELQDTNINLTCICPYFFTSNMFKGKKGYPWPLSKLFKIYNLEEITVLIYRDILYKKNMCIYPEAFKSLLDTRFIFPLSIQDQFISLGNDI